LLSESYAAELELLQRAQAAYAGRDFTDALTVVAEHRRRFPNGRLTEEREALRVRALKGAGRTNESRAAAASFAARFPRSVLLPRLSPESK
jgi:outer membrane protein assembly factor BamD (BamD/ComL family)